MSNALYQKGRQAFANAGINLSADTIKCALVTAGYTPNLATHQFYSDLTPGSNVLGTPQVLTFVSDVNGLFKASNPTFTAVPAGTATYLAIYKDTGTTTTSPLIGLIDTATGLPYTAIGGSSTIPVAFDAVNGIFTL